MQSAAISHPHTRVSFMNRLAFAAAPILVGLSAATPARAASLQKVNDWGASGVPGTASMYVYVPDTPAEHPPILVVAHFCGGSADAVFGQAQGGGIVSAADQYGFIIVVPQTSNNCWDVGSTKSLTHDGGGETQAVAQMVEHAIATYGANADRVYITGDSSGGMMTQAMLAVYPDVFKGGAEFAGVPAGCWAVGNPDGSWSGQCADGQVTHTAEEWGDLARDMYPTYTGHRPRVQLFHGDGDPTIRYANHTEAIKQWTNLLGLSSEPSATDTVTLGSHQATREQWQNDCGYVVLEAYTSLGGDHGPSDAIFDASYVIPFLGLDDTSAVDPEIAQCDAGSGGSGDGAGGTSSAPNSGGAGGATLPTASSGGANAASAGQPNAEGSAGGQAGVVPDATPSAGTNSSPIAIPPSGAGGSAGNAPPSAPSASASDVGAPSPTPSATPTIAASSAAPGGAPSGGESASPLLVDDATDDESGCSCRVGGASASTGLFPLALAALLALARRRHGRIEPSRSTR